MALTDYDRTSEFALTLPGYAHDPTMPAGYIGNSDPNKGTVWQSQYNPLPGPGISYPDAQGRYPWTGGYGSGPAPVVSPINQRLKDLFGGFTGTTSRMGSPGGGYGGASGAPGSAGYMPSMNANGAGRPQTNFAVGATLASPRSMPVQNAVNTAYGARSTNQAVGNQSLTDWTKEFIASRKPSAQFAGEETGAISRFYGSGPDSVGGDLSRIRNNQAASLRDLTEQAYRRAGRDNSLRRMGRQPSSYLDNLHAQQFAGIAAQGAYRQGDQERADLAYVNSARTGMAGQRQNILDQQLNQNLLPYQTASQFEGDGLNRLGQLANLDYGNNTYQPVEDAYSKRAAFLQQLMEMGIA